MSRIINLIKFVVKIISYNNKASHCDKSINFSIGFENKSYEIDPKQNI